MPPICHLFATYLHRNLIGTSSESHRNLIGTSPSDERIFKQLSPKYHLYLQPCLLSRMLFGDSLPLTLKLQTFNKKICSIQNNSVPLHREPAPGMSAHQRRRVADIIKKRLLALVLVNRNLANFKTPRQESDKCPWCV